MDLHLSLGILRIQQGLDLKENADRTKTASNESLTNRNISFGQMSQGSSCSDLSAPATPIPRTKDFVSSNPNPEEQPLGEIKVKIPSSDHFDTLLEDVPKEAFLFQKKQKRGGTIDVWWLYDDGGLTLLLPYIISTRRNWSSCKLRVFTLANKFDELECEHRNMASLLAKFRIDYSDLQIVPDITSKALECTQQFFESLIADFRKPSSDGSTSGNFLDFKSSEELHIFL